MKKEIGSIFPLSDKVIKAAELESTLFSPGRLYYALCREALFDIAQSLVHTKKVVLLPAYTCQTVITPFQEAEWDIRFYSIQRDLRIDLQNLIDQVAAHTPSLVVVHPFYGMELNNKEERVLSWIAEQGVKILLDITQCIFSIKRYPFVSYTVGSYRKWFPIPDGGFLDCPSETTPIAQPQEEYTDFCEREIAAMYLRDLYFSNGEQRTKDISIRMSKSADRIADINISPHRMSSVAYNLLCKEEWVFNQQRRIDNFTFLFENVHKSDNISIVCQDLKNITTAPLYFTIYAHERTLLQRDLAQQAVYAPVLWPVEDKRVLINDDVTYIYNHILAIPCDQRYDLVDMQRIVNVLNAF